MEKILQTPNMSAECICAHDFADLNRLHQNEKAMMALGGVRSAEKNRTYLKESLAHWEKYGFGLWIFRSKENQFIGRGGLRHVEILGIDEIEIAYALMPEFWGQGLATEIAQLSVSVAFNELKLANLICFTQTTHVASRRVMEKVGFSYEKELILYENPHVVYRLNNPR